MLKRLASPNQPPIVAMSSSSTSSSWHSSTLPVSFLLLFVAALFFVLVAHDEKSAVAAAAAAVLRTDGEDDSGVPLNPPLWVLNLTAWYTPGYDLLSQATRATTYEDDAYFLVAMDSEYGGGSVTAVCLSLIDGSIKWSTPNLPSTRQNVPSHSSLQCNAQLCAYADHWPGVTYFALERSSGKLLWANRSQTENWIWGWQLIPEGMLLVTDAGFELSRLSDGLAVWGPTSYQGFDEGHYTGRLGYQDGAFYFIEYQGAYWYPLLLVCADAATGQPLWHINFDEISWGNGTVRDMLVVVAAAGTATATTPTLLIATEKHKSISVVAYNISQGRNAPATFLWKQPWAFNYSGCDGTYKPFQRSFLETEGDVLVGITCTAPPPPPPTASQTENNAAVSSSSGSGGNALYLTAVNISTGQALWWQGPFAVSGSDNSVVPPTILDGVVLFGVDSSQGGGSGWLGGSLQGFDARTGALLWTSARTMYADDTSASPFTRSAKHHLFVGSVRRQLPLNGSLPFSSMESYRTRM